MKAYYTLARAGKVNFPNGIRPTGFLTLLLVVTDVYSGLKSAGQPGFGDFFGLITGRADHNLDAILGKQTLRALSYAAGAIANITNRPADKVKTICHGAVKYYLLHIGAFIAYIQATGLGRVIYAVRIATSGAYLIPVMIIMPRQRSPVFAVK